MCPARGILNNNVFKVTIEHTHPPIHKELRERAFKQDLCRAVMRSNDSYSKLYKSCRRK